MLWAGLGTTGKVFILISNAIFPVIINTYAGARDVRGSMLEVGKAYGATQPQIFFKILLPSAVPFIMTGLRLAVGHAIIGIVVAEFLTAQTGLGGRRSEAHTSELQSLMRLSYAVFSLQKKKHNRTYKASN